MSSATPNHARRADVELDGQWLSSFALVRPHGPVRYDAEADVWRVTRHRDARRILADPETFGQLAATNHDIGTIDYAELNAHVAGAVRPGSDGNFIQLDPPRHTSVRRAVVKAMQVPRRSRALESEWRSMVSAAVAPLAAGRRSVSAMSQLADPLVTRLLTSLMGMSETGWLERRKRSPGLARSGPEGDAQEIEYLLDHKFQRYVVEEIEAATFGESSGALAGLVSQVREDLLRPLDVQEILAFTRQLDTASISSTRHTLASALWFALRRPVYLRPSTLEDSLRVADETMRLEPSLRAIYRRSKQATSVDGVLVPSGAALEIHMATLNRDPDVFEKPYRFDPDRPNVRRHLALGYGPHACLGAGFVRRVVGVSLTHLLALPMEVLEAQRNEETGDYTIAFTAPA